MQPTLAAPASRLLAFYLLGRIAEQAWIDLMQVFDTETVPAPDREALSAFVGDVLREGQAPDMRIPTVEEVEALLEEVRA